MSCRGRAQCLAVTESSVNKYSRTCGLLPGVCGKLEWGWGLYKGTRENKLASRKGWEQENLSYVCYCIPSVPTDGWLSLMKLRDASVTRGESKLFSNFFSHSKSCASLECCLSRFLAGPPCSEEQSSDSSLLPKDNPTAVDSRFPPLVFWSVGKLEEII